MNDTTDIPTTPPPPPPPPGGEESAGGGPDRERLRSVADATRSTDGRMLTGVAAGLGRHLGIDPIIVRVVFVALTFLGLAGVVLYVTAWFLLPTDDGRRSIAAEWFRLDRNEPQVRTVGLILGGIAAVGAVIGDSGWFWWGGPWPLFVIGLPALGLYWLFVVLPRRRRDGRTPTDPPPAGPSWPGAASPAGSPAATSPAGPAGDTEGTTVPAGGEAPPAPPTWTAQPAAPRRMRPPLLLLATLSAMAAVLGSLALWDVAADRDLTWTAYVVAALLVTGAALVVGAWWGRSVALVLLGVVLSGVLAIGSLLPDGRIGEIRVAPTSAAGVESDYQLGIGLLELDLREVDDPEDLRGRTIRLDAGFGETRVLLPDDLAVTVVATVDGGAIDVLGIRDDGRSARVVSPADGRPSVRILIDQTFGQITVDRS
ncbi:PspC domain-containing protein [Aeromicrobium marinum]|nr:PspC domain-containing protein [Aeromicrobium marinum]